MNDMAEIWNDVRDRRRKMRAAFGIECPRCKEKRPKSNASILLPGQYCKVDGYRDPRGKITPKQKRDLR